MVTDSDCALPYQIERWIGGGQACYPDGFGSGLASASVLPNDVEYLHGNTDLDEDDVFRIDVPPGRTFEYSLLPWDPSIIVSQRLLDEAGVEIQNGLFIEVENAGVAAMTTYLEVSSDECAEYDVFQLDITPSCGTDPFEPNNSVADASTSLVHGQTYTLNGSTSDPDLFRVAVPAFSHLEVAAGPLNWTAGTVTVSAHDLGGTELISPTRLFGSTMYTNDTAQEQTAVIRVDAMQTSTCVPYFFDVGVRSCQNDDVWEPNDSLETAVNVVPAGVVSVSEGSPDFFDVGWVADGGHVLGLANADQSALNITLWDATAQQSLSSGVNSADWTNTTGSPVHLVIGVEVPGTGPCMVDYTLQIDES